MVAILPLLVPLLLLGTGPSAVPPPVPREASGIPQDGDRVVFIGDSITQAGRYVVYVEAFLLTRFPDRTITVINHGLSSETVAGTSEPDHPSPRPCIHDRFDRDVTAWRPDRVVSCYGMNDGIYHPFDPEILARYQDGIRRLIERADAEADARIDLLTPPPYDPYRRQVGDPDASYFGYRYPSADYDEVLDRFGEWIETLGGDDLLVADVHDAFNSHLSLRRADRASVSLSPDGVHPDTTGHWLIAQTLLKAWDAPPVVADIRVDASGRLPQPETVRDVSNRDGAVSFDWDSPLPMPIDPAWDPESLRVDSVSDLLNRYRLAVTGLEGDRYRLLASFEGEEPGPVGSFSAGELARGIDLNTIPVFPTVAASRQVLGLLSSLRDAQGRAFRASIRGESSPDAPPPPGEDAEQMGPIRDLCRPKALRIFIEPIPAPSPGS
ncbi:SGNH/GDSL hydrolase family protein [Tautonia plasticadhaerens]|uniref:GDSL-like Lipase/Acylhydrolase n=1 Tax=Tautonia plasticadhaerens TaxID=2527974 RepID=A0A518GY57_9BACT|nr:SGNH/GDSL hydrolase family protein [Tautonia plasticadhaerens]QDV33536.1 GDSL-like Lipase/Acylhydrolase [Tautonia plasticadhaerens]